jgi:Arc/MetJ-type ribon-helix-helix transcriptional regulator
MGSQAGLTKKTRGRPATGRDPMLNFRSPPELTAKLDAWIAAQPEPRPSRSETIRRLLEKALAK